jgi:hypothetical protein
VVNREDTLFLQMFLRQESWTDSTT